MAGVFLQTIYDEVRQALDRGDTDLAIGMAQHILAHAPDVIEGHRLLGEAYLNAGQFAEASASFENVLRADPEHIAAYYGLGLAQRSLHRTTHAIHALERALEIQPNLAELRTQLLQLYALTPNSAGQFRLSRSGLGRLYARGQMYTQAIDEFRAVFDTESDRDDIRVALAEALWRDGQEDAAVEWCRQTIANKPDLFKPTLILGYLQLAAGQPEGEALWRRAAAQEPTLATAAALFSVLPPLEIDEPTIPPFDEDAWRAANTPQAVADVVAPAAPPAVTSAQSDDDLLASLLGFDFDDATQAPPPAASDDATQAPPLAASDDVVSGAADIVPDQAVEPVPDAVPIAPAADAARAEPSNVRTYEAATVEPQAIALPTRETEASPVAPLDDDAPGTDAQPYPMFRRPLWSASTSFGRVEPFQLEDWDSTQNDEASPDAAQTTDAQPWVDMRDEPLVAASEAQPWVDMRDAPPVAEPSLESSAQTAAEEAATPVARTPEPTIAPDADAPLQDARPRPDADAQPPESAEQVTQHDRPPDVTDPYQGVKPFSLADLDDEPFDDDRASFEVDTSDDVRPFSMRELGFEQRATEDATPESAASVYAAAPAARQSSAPGGNLGLNDDDLMAWERAARTDSTPYEPPVYDTPTSAQEPVTPFSLADIGLTDEDQERWSVDPPLTTAGRTTSDEETTPFSLADFEPPSTPTPTFASADPAIHEAETQPFDVSALLGSDTPADPPATEPASPADATPAPAPERSTFQRFHEQLAVDPDNHNLRLALARALFHQHDVEHAFEQYRQLVQRGALFEPVLEDLQDILQGTDDRSMLRRVHKLMGDIYMAQGHTDKAVDAYSWT